jgi:hypothetical protein
MQIGRTDLTETAVKYVQGTVVRVVLHVIHKVFEFKFDTVTVIVFAALEHLIAVLLGQSLIEAK